MESLVTIFDRHNTDKNSSFHNYCRQYDVLLKQFRERKTIKYLEIGVCNGDSLRAIYESFPNAELIVGIDINQECKIHENSSKNIFVEIGNATSDAVIHEITEKYGHFDIILDDGSHYNQDVIATFELLFPLLNEDGVYIVEDTICYKLPGYQHAQIPHHLSYFTEYIYYLNQSRYDSTDESSIKDHCIDPFKIEKKSANIFECTIDKIEFGCSYIALFKKTRKHWITKK